MVSLGLIAANLAVFSQIRGNDFVNWDDPLIVGNNPHILGGLTWEGVKWSISAAYYGDWHPIVWWSHMLDVELFGLNAGSHHLSSVFYHIADTLLLFWLLYYLTNALGRSAFVAGLFAEHPQHVESVAWLAARTDVVSTLFWLLTLWSYVWYAQRPGLRRYILVFVLYGCALMSKPMVVTLPFVLLLMDLWPLGRVRQYGDTAIRTLVDYFRKLATDSKILILEKIPFMALSVASVISTIVGRGRGVNEIEFKLDPHPMSFRLENAAVTYVTYLEKMVWPSDLTIWYPYSETYSIWLVFGSVLVLAGVSLLAIKTVQRNSYMITGWLWYLGTLIPVIGLIQIGEESRADRYTYIPLIGIFIMVAWGLYDLLDRLPHRNLVLGSAGTLAVIVLIFPARAQVRYWQNSVVLWQHALDVTSENYRANNNLGNALLDQGKIDEAIAHFNETIRIKPDFGNVRNNLGNALAKQGKLDEAVVQYNEAIRIIPNYPQAHNGLGSVLDDQGNYEDAIQHYKLALRGDPEFVAARNNLGVALAKQGKYQEALQEFLEVLRLKPNEVDAHYNAAVMLEELGNPAEAVQHLEAALRLDPKHSEARRALDELRLKAR